MRYKLERCPACEREGQPFLTEEDGYFFIECEQCLDDIVYCRFEEDALKLYREKCSEMKSDISQSAS